MRRGSCAWKFPPDGRAGLSGRAVCRTVRRPGDDTVGYLLAVEQVARADGSVGLSYAPRMSKAWDPSTSSGRRSKKLRWLLGAARRGVPGFLRLDAAGGRIRPSRPAPCRNGSCARAGSASPLVPGEDGGDMPYPDAGPEGRRVPIPVRA